MATTAREIGQIFAQQINFRQAIKDRIEDYIMKTELAALDPAVMRQRQAEINRMRDALGNLDKEIADIMEKKVAGVDDIAQRWVAADGSVKAQEVAAGGRVEAARIGAQSDIQEAIIRSRTALEEARLRGESAERIAEIERNTGILQDLRKEEARGEAGTEQNLGKVIEGARTFAGTDIDQVSNALSTLWETEYKPKFIALDGSPLAQRRLVEQWTTAANTFVDSIAAPQAQAAIRDELVAEQLTPAELGIRAAGLPVGFLQIDKAETLMKEATKRGYEEPAAKTAIQYYASGKTAGVGARPPSGRAPTSAPRAALLGLQDDAQVAEFEKLAAYNKFLVDNVGPRGEVPTKTFEQFIAESQTAGSDAANRIARSKTAAPAELAQFGDSALVDLMLRRKGAQAEITDVKNAFDQSGSKFPTYESVQRKTLETYSQLYGGRGQQRVVELAQFGRKVPLTYTDAEGREQSVSLDVPELELLFGGSAVGGGGGGRATPSGESVRQSTVIMGLDQNLTGRPSGMQSQGRGELGYVPKEGKFGYELLRPFPPAEPEPPFNPDLTGDQRGMGGQLPSYITEQPAPVRREGVPGETRRPTFEFGEPQSFGEAAQMATTVPATDATRFKAAPLDQALLEAPAPVPPTPKAEKSLESMSEFELEGELKAVIEKSKRLQAELQMADPTRAAQIQDELKALGDRARQILITSKSVPISKEDFDTLSQEELVAKVQPKPQPINLSAQAQRANTELVTFAEGTNAASKAQKEIDAGKEANPVKYIKGASKLSEGQVATIKNLAQKRGTVPLGQLSKTLASILGTDINSPLVEKAKSLYIAFEQLA